MPRLALAVAVVLVTAVAWAAPAPGVSVELHDAIVARRGALGSPTDRAAKKVTKALDKATRILGARKAGKSRADEIKAVSKAVKQLAKKAPDETELLDLAADARATYRDTLFAEAQTLRSIVEAGVLRGKRRKSAAKASKRIDKAGARADAAADDWRALKDLASVGKSLRVLEGLGLDGGDDFAWIIDSLAVAPGVSGLDLDGDGEPDNGLGGAQSALAAFGVSLPVDEPLAAAIADGSLAFVIQMWLVDDFENDPIAFAGTISPTDDDADPSDNFSGAETFTAIPGTVDDDGRSIVRSAVTLRSGVYEVAVERELEIPLGETPVQVDGLVRVAATADAISNDGLLGFLIPGAAVETFLEASPDIEPAFVGLALQFLLDVDSDGDGTADAMSVALEFTSVPCTVLPPPAN